MTARSRSKIRELMAKARELRERAASTVVPLHRHYHLADARLLEQIADTLRALD